MTHNGEDATIDRLLGYKDTGFYIDVGANDPLTTSNTHHLYERGWRGIDIEPNSILSYKLQKTHPQNRVFDGAASDYGGLMDLYGFAGHEYTTTDESIRQEHIKSGKNLEYISTVKCDTLDNIIDHYLYGKTRSPDFVSIDVEGAEYSVLRGFNLWRWRPKLLCIKATSPLDLSIRTDTDWKPILYGAQYKEVYFDGCNAWYMPVSS